ncbi:MULTISPECIES: hypothetical protein [Calditerrivibrio]|uniref:hypothetical protein n=1 Tax=Calditerrivibrio TaxID=545865 RepID=UPI003C70EE74
MKSLKGYSTLETLIVLIIISIFISILYSKYKKIEHEAKLSIRGREIYTLNLMIELYKSKKGRYPDNLSTLFLEGVIDNKTIEFLNPSKRLKNGKFYDPLGEEYLYDNNTGKIIN